MSCSVTLGLAPRCFCRSAALATVYAWTLQSDDCQGEVTPEKPVGSQWSPRSIRCPALRSRKLAPMDGCPWPMPLSGCLPGPLESGTGQRPLGGRGPGPPRQRGQAGRLPQLPLPPPASTLCPTGPLPQPQLLAPGCFPRQLASGSQPRPR